MRSLEPDSAAKILLRGTNWVGDAVMSIPAMREIRRLFPRAQISLLVRSWVKDVYSAVEFIDEVIEYDNAGLHRGVRGLLRLCSDLRSRRFDLAILLQNAIEAAIISRLAVVPRILGYARDGRGPLLTHPIRIDPEIKQLHQVYYYLGILKGAGLLEPQSWPERNLVGSIRIGVTDKDLRDADVLLAERGVRRGEILIGINPGATYGGAKRWLTDRYAEVADRLASSFAARILIFGSRSERAIAQSLAGQTRCRPIVMAGLTTLAQLMGLLSRCNLLITNDSGPMHLAAALDVPQIAIFGSTSEVATGPLSQRATVIKNPVYCSPCFLRECPIDLRCMTGISVERVVSAATKLLEGGGP